VEAREALVEALAGFAGAVVAVSHDRHLLGLVADRLILVDGGTARDFAGTLDDYRDMVLRPGSSGAEEGGERSAKRAGRKDERRIAADGRESSKALRKQVAQAEAELKLLWRRRSEIDAMLARPRADGALMSELMKSRAEIERRLAGAEQSWIEASEAVERSQR
jgi:ATP-binding cassette, subfamily F, member 3